VLKKVNGTVHNRLTMRFKGSSANASTNPDTAFIGKIFSFDDWGMALSNNMPTQ